ncbi:gp11 [Sphingomonas phage PAU]|uniref:gp11 n=1 Tax=Sphingomonas phage PAU TaxID=1150991 RepID=UPI0002573110|nr:gp11 [Sphingomonas phage PAU]AFF28009.1 gp11 [Sphingomonas phage PAU]
MKIINKTITVNEVQELSNTLDRLVESFDRCPTVKEFLMENGNSEETANMFAKMALTECVIDKEKTFLFENGMRIPTIGAKMKSLVTLNGLFEAAENEDEFVQLVENNILPKLDIEELSECDEENLREVYKENKSK